ncbi:MAG: rhomboid family intramembrane serine protease [Bacteroidota bacterium]
MAYYEKEYKRRLSLGQGNNALVTLIAIHLILFVILAFIKAILHLKSPNGAEVQALFDHSVMNWFSLPADINKIAAKPWTILTYMFVHADFWHVFGNMLWLWTFGYILQDLTGNRKIFPVFLYGALFGAVAFVLAYNFLPALKPHLAVQTAIGASAGVMAIAVAATFIAPGYRIFPMLRGGIPLWVITAIYPRYRPCKHTP